jgi:uncharacterized membrane protein
VCNNSTGDNIVIDQAFIFLGIRKRLTSEIRDLSKRAHINLLVGSIFSSVGFAFILIYFFVSDNISTESSINGSTLFSSFILKFIPRITLLIFTNVFSFFFLNLYRQMLNEIKYFQNEITSIELKQIAIMYCEKLGDQEIKKM